MEPGLHALWPTPLGVHRLADADALNALLVRVFGALRATQQQARGQEPGAFFASDDDLSSVSSCRSGRSLFASS